MKNNLRPLAALIVILLSLNSCSMLKENKAHRKDDTLQSKEVDTNCFAEMNDGTIKHFSKLKLVKGIFKTPHLLGDGKQKIKPGQIKAYQNKDHYAISQADFITGHRSFIAKETLPGFATRISKGKINVFVKKYYNGIAAIDEFFIQQGGGGQIVAYTTESMNRMIDNDAEALEFFINKQLNTPKTKRTQSTVLGKYPGKLITRTK